MSTNQPKPQKRCAIYARCAASTPDRENLGRQRKICADFIAAHKKQGWIPVSGIYEDDGVSGLKLNRPALKALLADARQGLIDAVICKDAARLSRDIHHHDQIIADLEHHGIEVIFVPHDDNDE